MRRVRPGASGGVGAGSALCTRCAGLGECAASDMSSELRVSEISMHRNNDCANDLRRSTTNPMNRTLALVSALTLGLTTTLGIAQAAGPQAPPAASAAPVAPQAVPAKIALIQFEQAAAATNEGQRS